MKTLVLSIIALIYLLLYLFVGLSNKSLVVNIIIGIIIIILIINSFIVMNNNKPKVCFGNFLTSFILIIIMFNIIITLFILPPELFENKEREKVYKINSSESIKLVPYGDSRFSDYGRLYYEKQLPLGFKCMKLIKSDVTINEPINQEEIYNKLNEKYYGFCKIGFLEQKGARNIKK